MFRVFCILLKKSLIKIFYIPKVKKKRKKETQGGSQNEETNNCVSNEKKQKRTPEKELNKMKARDLLNSA